MRTVRFASWSLWVSLFVLGCQTGRDKEQDQPQATAAAGERPASVTPELAATAERVMGHLEAIAATANANLADCSKAAATIRDAMAAARRDLDKMESMAEDEKAQEWFVSTYETRAQAATQNLQAATKACSQSDDFRAVIAELRKN